MGLSTYSFNDAFPQQPPRKTRCARKTEHTRTHVPTRARAHSCLSSALEELSQSIYQGILLLGFEKKGHTDIFFRLPLIFI